MMSVYQISLQLILNVSLALLNILLIWFAIKFGFRKLRGSKIVKKKFLYISIIIVCFIIFWIDIYLIFNINFIK